MAKRAIEKNKLDDPSYTCRFICIEPYEQPWLETIGVEVVRQVVEKVDMQMFDMLGVNDILFIDSSHIIRPQGDVVKEYLEIIPNLKPGVLVHVHDIFTPRDYLEKWIVDDVRLWNEQYMLEALISENAKVKIVVAANYLAHNWPEQLAEKCPVFSEQRVGCEPGSFWFARL